MDLNSPGFSTEDLVVKRQADRASGSPDRQTAKLESKMIRAALTLPARPTRRLLKSAPALLKEGRRTLYKEVVASNDKKFRLYETAVKDNDVRLPWRFSRPPSKVSRTSSNPLEAKKARAEAGDVFDKKAQGYKDEAEKAYPDFQAALKRYNDEMKRLNPEGRRRQSSRAGVH